MFRDPLSAALEVLEFKHLPFMPKRAYWIFDFCIDGIRGNHAHKSLRQLFVLIKGSIQIDVKDEAKVKSFLLDEKSDYLLLEAGLWRVLRNPSPDAVLMVIVDQEYSEDDYIRNWEEFLEWRKNFV